MADNKPPVKIVCLSLKEFMAMDFPDPTPDHPGYDTWKADCEFRERKKHSEVPD